MFQSAPSSSGEEILSRIHSFRQRLAATRNNESTYRDEDLTVEETKWNIEANLNSIYGKADEPFSDLDVLKKELVVAIDDGKVPNNEVLSAYDLSLDHLIAHYNTVNSNTKQISIIDVKLIEMSSTEAKFEVTSYIAKAIAGPPPGVLCDDIFEENENWHAINGDGMCSGAGVQGFDAADMLETEINFRNPSPSGNHLFFTSIENVELHAWSYQNPDDDIFDEYRDYLIWQCNEDFLNQYECMDWIEMNWYYCNLESIINNETPPGKTFSHLYFIDEVIFSSNTTFLHFGWATYGISIQCDCDPCDPSDPFCDTCC